MDETKQIIDLLRELVELQSITGRSSSSNTSSSFDDSWFKSYKKTIEDLKNTTQDLTKMSRSELEADKSLIEQKIKNGQLTKEEISVKLKLLEVAIKTRISEETKLEVTKKTVKSLNDFQKTLSELNSDVSKFNKFIEGMGSGAESLIKNSVKIDTFGQKLGLESGKLGTSLSVAAKALTSLTTVALTQTQQLLKAFDDLSEVGSTTYETTESIRKLGADAGYSGEALLRFSNIAKGVGSNLIGLGTSASSGLKVFSEMAKVGNKTYEAFNRLGVSQEQLTEAQAGYVKQAMLSNAIGKKAPEELRKASLDYVEALVKLRDLTGMNIKEQQSALEAALAQKNFSVYINSRELEAQELRNKAAKMQEGAEKQRTIAQMKAIEAEVNGKKAAAIAVSQLDEKTRTAYLQGMSTAGETVMSELVAQQEKLAGHQISAVNRLLNQGKVVEALTLFQNSTVNAVQTSTKTFGSLAALGSGFDEIHDKFMGGAQNYETANRLQRISNEERQKEIEALLKSVETRKQEGIIVDKEGKERADGAKNTQNVINTLGREIGEFKSDVIDAMNPFTKSTLGAAAASGALMLAAGGAAGALTLLSGKKMLGALVGALGRLIGIGGAGAAAGAAVPGTGLATGAAGLAATATRFALPAAIMYGVANTGDYVAGKFGMGKDEKGEDLKINEEADDKNWERMSAGEKLQSGIARGIEKLGSLVGFSNISREAEAERIKKETEYFNKKDGKSTDTPLQTKPAESTTTANATTTVESGGQKAVNVNVVQSVPLTVNIDKFLDPLFKLSKLGPQPTATFDSDFTLADVNDKVTLPVKISAMSEGFETLFKSMNNHLFSISNKIEYSRKDHVIESPMTEKTDTGVIGTSTASKSVKSVLDSGPGWIKLEKEDGSAVIRKGTVSWRMNNPGNLRYTEFSKKMGAIGEGDAGKSGKFAVFPTLESGLAAQKELLFGSKSNYLDLSIKDAISRYAPESNGNNPVQYANIVSKSIGVPTDTKLKNLTSEQRQGMIDAIIRQEGFKEGETVNIPAPKKINDSSPISLNFDQKLRVGSIPTEEKNTTKTFSSLELLTMIKKEINENMVMDSSSNVNTMLSDPIRDLIVPYFERQEKMMGLINDTFQKMLSEMEQSNSTQSNILAYTRN